MAMKQTPYQALFQAQKELRLDMRKNRLAAFHFAAKTVVPVPGDEFTDMVERRLSDAVPAGIRGTFDTALIVASSKRPNDRDAMLRDARARLSVGTRCYANTGAFTRPARRVLGHRVDTTVVHLMRSLLRVQAAMAARDSCISSYQAVNAFASLCGVSIEYRQQCLRRADSLHLDIVEDLALPAAHYVTARPGNAIVADVAAAVEASGFDLDSVAILGDAVEEYGLGDEVVTALALHHLRAHRPHFEGCWVVDLCLGGSP
jgi:hypothetical protein